MPHFRIVTRLAIAYVLVCLIPTIIACALIMAWVQRQVSSDEDQRLVDVAILIDASIDQEFESGRSTALQDKIRKLGHHTGVRITLITNEGVVIADSTKETVAEVSTMNNHRERPELKQAMEQGSGRDYRTSPTVGTPFVYYALRIDRNGEAIGLVRTSLRSSTMRERVVRIWKQLVLLATIIGIVNLAMIYYSVSRFMKRLTTLRTAADAIATGDYHQRVSVENDKDGGLGASFNRMSGELAKTVTELREQGEQLVTVLGGIGEAVIAVDDQKSVLFANRLAGNLLDFDALQASGKPLLESVRNQSLHDATIEALSSGVQTQTEVEIGGNVNRILDIRANPLPGKPCSGVVLVIQDVTELRRLEGLRQEFIANVSHELKTPLSSIKAYSETLLNGALRDEANNEKFVQKIAEQSDRLQELILDMLSLARIESAQKSYEIVPVSVEDVVDESLAAHQTSAAAKQIKLSTEAPDSPLTVKAESEALRQILDNLIKNSVMYTGSGGTITVSWATVGEAVEIRVRDTGIGISLENQSRLFERFFRVDKARSREQGGTGLGLSIVKHLTQFFGGTVRVESELGKGSIFIVSLPSA